MDYKYLFSVFYLLFLCQITNAQPFRFIVAKDGSGTHTSIQKAIMIVRIMSVVSFLLRMELTKKKYPLELEHQNL